MVLHFIASMNYCRADPIVICILMQLHVDRDSKCDKDRITRRKQGENNERPYGGYTTYLLGLLFLQYDKP